MNIVSPPHKNTCKIYASIPRADFTSFCLPLLSSAEYHKKAWTVFFSKNNLDMGLLHRQILS